MISKKRCKKNDFYLRIYELIIAGKSPYGVCPDSRQRAHYYIRQMVLNGLIAKKGYGVWEVKKDVKISSIRSRPIFNLHALQIKIPILSGRIIDADWQVIHLRHWAATHTKIDIGGEILEIQNNNNKSILIRAKSRDLKNLADAYTIANKVSHLAYSYFKAQGVTLDLINRQVTNKELATEDEELEGKRKKADKVEVRFDKEIEPIFDKDKGQSKAWLDPTPYDHTVETNDIEYAREYLYQPFRIRDISHSMFLLSEYNTNLKLHKEVQTEQLDTLKELKELIRRLGK